MKRRHEYGLLDTFKLKSRLSRELKQAMSCEMLILAVMGGGILSCLVAGLGILIWRQG